MSNSRRDFLLGSGALVSGVWVNPVEAHDLPAGKTVPLDIPRAPRSIYAYPQLGTSTNSMLLCMGKYQPEMPWMTWRKYLIQQDYELGSQAQIKEVAREFAIEPEWLDIEIWEHWLTWEQASSPKARAYRFLTKLNLGEDLDWIHWSLKPYGAYQDRRALDFSFHQIGGPIAEAGAGFKRRNGKLGPVDTSEDKSALYFRDSRAGYPQIEVADGTSLEMLQARFKELDLPVTIELVVLTTGICSCCVLYATAEDAHDELHGPTYICPNCGGKRGGIYNRNDMRLI